MLALQELYKKQFQNKQEAPPMDQAVCAFLDKHPIDESVELARQTTEANSAWEQLDNLRNTLALTWMAYRKPVHWTSRWECLPLVQELYKKPLWRDCQLHEALLALNCQLAGLAHHELRIQQCPSGAAALEPKCYWPWAGVPQLQAHAELGILWATLGQLRQSERLLDAAYNTALWQTQTLDSRGLPQLGLYNPEQDASWTKTLASNALLFHTAACIRQDQAMAGLAHKQIKALTQSSYLEAIPAWLAVLSEGWTDTPEPMEGPLREVIFDPHTALAGYRDEQHSVACTLCGGNTGLGSFQTGDVAILSYGPQVLPLDHCRHFGIESACEGTSQHNPTQVQVGAGGFKMQGRVRVASVASEPGGRAQFRVGEPSGRWLDLKQEYQYKQLSIQGSVYSLHPLDTLSFTFFVKGIRCVVDQEQTLNPRSLNRYHGKVRSVRVEGAENQITISTLPGKGELEVIPLSGGRNFWGADFMIAHVLDPETFHYTWRIS